MQKQIQQWVKVSANLKRNLEYFVETANAHNTEKILALYHPKAQVFPSMGTLKIGHTEIEKFMDQVQVQTVPINYGSVSYNTETNLVEGEYELALKSGRKANAQFAIKYDQQNRIVEHASAPIETSTWRLKNEVSVCTLLTAATVQSILKQETAISPSPARKPSKSEQEK